MPIPQITVTFYADLPFAPDHFTLNDTTRGQLNSTTYKLYASSPIDVSSDVNVVSIRRGNSSQLFPDVNAGTATVQLNNETRKYDPLNSSSPFFGNILPGRRFTIAANGVTLFDGRSEDWNFVYDPNGRSVAIVTLVDGLAVLARQQFSDWTPTGGQKAGARLAAVLDRPEVQWPASRSLDTGVSTLSADPVSFGDSVVEYCNTVAKSDLGYFYCSRSGVITFRDRHANLNTAAAVTFSDDGTGTEYSGVGVAYGSELLFNRIGVQAAGFGPVTVLSLASQYLYGIRSYTTPTLLLNSSAQMLDMGNYLAGIYDEPEVRFDSLELTVHGLTTAKQNELMALDISSVVRVKFQPNKTGATIDRYCIVSGIEHDISAMGGSHSLTLRLGDVDRRSVLRLDDVAFGRLDANVLAF